MRRRDEYAKFRLGTALCKRRRRDQSGKNSMLKITNNNDDKVTTFKLEGKLSGEWVNELWNCWQQSMSVGDGKSLRIDLAGVSWVSDEGKALLRAMQRNGAELMAANLLTAGIIAEIGSETTD